MLSDDKPMRFAASQRSFNESDVYLGRPRGMWHNVNTHRAGMDVTEMHFEFWSTLCLVQ